MAKVTVTTTTCDVPVRNKPCGKTAKTGVDVAIGNKRYHGDVCEKHLPDLNKAFDAVGIQLAAGRVDSKDRKAMQTASGKAFTTQEAREWLMAQGIIQNPTGRIGKANLNLYAEAH